MQEINMNDMASKLNLNVSKIKDINTFKTEDLNTDFNSLLKNAIQKVEYFQNNAEELSVRFEKGDKSVDLSEVMVALQKANISLQAMTQVRNRFVSAYQEIMNMQI